MAYVNEEVRQSRQAAVEVCRGFNLSALERLLPMTKATDRAYDALRTLREELSAIPDADGAVVA